MFIHLFHGRVRFCVFFLVLLVACSGKDEVNITDNRPFTIAGKQKIAINKNNFEEFRVSGSCANEGEEIKLISPVEEQAVCANGQWSMNMDLSALPDGSIDLEFQQTDSETGETVTEEVSIVKDTSAPTVSAAPAGSVVTSSNEATYTISGTCTENNTVLVEGLNGFSTQIDCTGGTWSESIDLSTLPDGESTLLVYEVDEGNNVSTATIEIEKDSSASDIEILSPTTDTTINLTNDSNVLLQGTCTDDPLSLAIGETITIGGDAATTTTTCQSDNTWSTTADFSEATPGVVNYTVTSTDSNGNTTTVTQSLNYSATTPAVMVTIPSLGASPSNDSSARTITLGGTGVTHYKAQARIAGDCHSVDYDAISEVTIGTNFTFTPVENFYNIVCAIGSDGSNWQSASESTVSSILYIDTQAPTAVIDSSGLGASPSSDGSSRTVSIGATDATTYKAVGTTDSDCSGVDFSGATETSLATDFTFTPTDGATNRVCAIAKDQVGNWQTAASSSNALTINTTSSNDLSIDLSTLYPTNTSDGSDRTIFVSSSSFTYYKAVVTEDGDCTTADFDNTDPTHIDQSFTFTPQEDSQNIVCIIGKNADDTWMDASEAIMTPPLVLDTTSPTIAGVSANTSDGSYTIGNDIEIAVDFSETVIVDTTGGTPYIILDTGSGTTKAYYTSGSGSDTLIFTYTVETGDQIADLDYVNSDSLVLNGGSITDSSGVDANTSLAAPGTAGSLGSSSDINVDYSLVVISFAAQSSSASEGAGSVNITVEINPTPSSTYTIDYVVTGGSATGSGTDYTLAPGTLTFNSGETSKDISVSINDDSLYEPNETLIVGLNNATNGATVGGQNSHTLTINENEPTPSFNFSTTASNSSESETTITIPVTLSSAMGETQTVNYTITNGTTSGDDYSTTSGILTFPAGSTSQDITFTINNDSDQESHEYLSITLDSPSGGLAVGTNSTLTHAILDDDTPQCAGLKVNYPSAGTYSVTVPDNCVNAEVKLWGAGGAGNTNYGSDPFYRGGHGAYVYGVTTFTPGESLTIKVGGGGTHAAVGTRGNGGFNGGGNGGIGYTSRPGGGGGGGATDIRRGGTALGNRTIIAGGGGGSGGGYGGSGASNGHNGTDWGNAKKGTGGTQSAGGVRGLNIAGTSPLSACENGTNGSLGNGGVGSGYAYGGGGGGGAGLYGGGGGACNNTQGAGGGGGSSKTATGLTVTATGSTSANPPGKNDVDRLAYNSSAGQGTKNSTAGSGLAVIHFFNTVPTKVSLEGPGNTGISQCTAFYVRLRDDSNEYAVSLSATTIDLSDSTGNGTFYSDSSCTTSITSTTLSAITYSKVVYYKNATTETTSLIPEDSANIFVGVSKETLVGTCSSSTKVVKSSPGGYSATLPAGCTKVSVKAWGAGGTGNGGNRGGHGAFVQGTVNLTAQSQVVYYYVGGGGVLGGGGYNGGGAGGTGGSYPKGGGGGGASDVRVGGTAYGNRVLVAGGGGGSCGGWGGSAVNPNGQAGTDWGNGKKGGGASQSGGGYGGAGAQGGTCTGVAGSLGVGGRGGYNSSWGNGGGGGGGFYGGGGGGCNRNEGGGAGGGSSKAPSGGSIAGSTYTNTNPPGTGNADYGGGAAQGKASGTGGHGRIVLEWLP